VIETVIGLGGWIVTALGFVYVVRKDRRDVAERRRQFRIADQAEDEKLSEFVVRQTENVIRGWQGVNTELRERAEAVLRELDRVTVDRDRLAHENEDLRGRVNDLETKVAALEGQGDADRRTIERLEGEVSLLKRGRP
jgi:chaperonin cofactor prefoldin